MQVGREEFYIFTRSRRGPAEKGQRAWGMGGNQETVRSPTCVSDAEPQSEKTL